jgi:hypothetical protein
VTFTYNTALTTNRDKVRLLIGDTNSSDAMFADEELCFFENEFGGSSDNVYLVALAAIDAGLLKYARKADSKSVGPLSISHSWRYKNLLQARTMVQALARRGLAAFPYTGVISVADKEIDEADDDVVKGWAKKGGFDNPGAADESDQTSIRDRQGF